MKKALQYKNDLIPGYFIDENGKIYNSVGQEQKFSTKRDYYFFKGHKVHQMVVHSFVGYKEGYDIHHINEIKTDNRLVNLKYLSHEEHTKIHQTGKKQSAEHIQKRSKKVFCVELNKVFDSIIQAARELKLSVGNIHNCCNGLRKTHGGYHFSYYIGDSK